MLASGLTEDITAGLTRFPSLFVVAPQSARGFKDSPLDVRQIAERLGARYVMGGSVRRSSSRTRVTAHLTDAKTGAQLWTETYDPEETDLYSIQDEITDRLVSTIADKTTGVLSRSLIQSTRDVPLDRLTARQLVYRCGGFEVRPTQQEHAELRGSQPFALNADDPELRAELGNLYLVEHSLFFNVLPDSLGRAFRAARRAIELDPSNQRGWVVLALCYFAGRDEAGLVEAADRVTRLNPRNSNAVAWMGNVLTHIGELDRGCQITKRAMALNTSHAGWYHFSTFNRHFARGEFSEALTAARRVNMADFMWMHLAIAASAGHLGLAAEGRAAIERWSRSRRHWPTRRINASW
jgi:adenylate cyclase